MLDLRLYLVTDSSLCGARSLEEIVEAAVKGGCTMVQLREKQLPTGAFIARARILKKVLQPYHVPLIINDRVDVVLAAHADGVHLGQSDMSPIDARQLLGPDAIIGLSIEHIDQVASANTMPVDYVAVSPIFATATKSDISTPLGLNGGSTVVERSVKPVIGIGGINHNTVAQAMQCGLKGVAVVSDIMAAANPEQSARELREIISRYENI
ncbi:MAG: thiamine phosphate synthase [Paludibacteraceae bacterium]|nr:thiamine phosphate synthase [Paludibacteraceae bacterium]